MNEVRALMRYADGRIEWRKVTAFARVWRVPILPTRRALEYEHRDFARYWYPAGFVGPLPEAEFREIA